MRIVPAGEGRNSLKGPAFHHLTLTFATYSQLINPVHHPLFNLTMQNKIDHANRILRLMDRYPRMTVKELFYWIACRIECEKLVVSSYRWSVPMLQEKYDNRDNLERLQFLVWHEGRVQFETDYGSASNSYPVKTLQRDDAIGPSELVMVEYVRIFMFKLCN